MGEISTRFRNIILILMIISGGFNTIAYKFQNTRFQYEGNAYKSFFHPYMQATTMFFGQFLSLFIFFAMKKKDPQGFLMRKMEAKSQGKQIQFNKFLLAIPASMDLITSTLQYISLNFIPGSVYQMMRGGTIVTTFIFSILFLKIKIQKHQILGSFLALLGIIIVGISNTVFAQPDSGGSQSAGLQIVGYLLIMGSLVTNGFLFVFQQKLLSKYHLQPLQVVGLQGMFGLFFYIVIICIITWIPCSFGISACVMDQVTCMPFLQSPKTFFDQIGNNVSLLIFVILGVFTITTFNITGVTVTKYISALARSICDVTRTIIVWIIGIILTASIGVSDPSFSWELLNVGAIIVQLVGFVILIFSNLVYNKIVRLPFLKYQNDEPLLDESVISQQNIQ